MTERNAIANPEVMQAERLLTMALSKRPLPFSNVVVGELPGRAGVRVTLPTLNAQDAAELMKTLLLSRGALEDDSLSHRHLPTRWRLISATGIRRGARRNS